MAGTAGINSRFAYSAEMAGIVKAGAQQPQAEGDAGQEPAQEQERAAKE